jgi:hypothetical protein
VECFGLDVRKRYTVFTCVDERGKLLGQGRVSNDAESLSQFLARSTARRSRNQREGVAGFAGTPENRKVTSFLL